MSLEKLFYTNLRWWNEHYESVDSSNPRDYLKCDGYRNLVVLGKSKKREMLGLIMDHWDVIPDFGLPLLVRAIVGNNFKIPERYAENVQKMRMYTLKWLIEHLLE